MKKRAFISSSAAFAASTVYSQSVLSQQATGLSPATQVINATRGVELKVTELASNLNHPWGLAVLPDARILITERSGQVVLLGSAAPNAKRTLVSGVLPVFARGQGGLLDIVVSPQFAQNQQVFYSFSKATTGNQAVTAVARARLVGNSLTESTVIFQQSTQAPGGYHFGSRLVFDRDGHLFVTTGDRYDLKDLAQSSDNHLGKVLRITVDGKPAPGNPVIKDNNATKALPEIWSLGHRNIQGAAVHPLTGELWTNEHGARGGDEVNLTLAGRNFGWPLITHGINYIGTKISDTNFKAGLEQPNHVWVPSIAVSGMAFDPRLTQGKQTVMWVGGLKSQLLAQIFFDGAKSIRETRYLENLGQRIRDVRWLNNKLLVLTDHSDGKLLSVDPPT